MKRLPISVFRLTLQGLSEATEVTIGGRIVGTWLPAHQSPTTTTTEDWAKTRPIEPSEPDESGPSVSEIEAAATRLKGPQPAYRVNDVLRRANRGRS